MSILAPYKWVYDEQGQVTYYNEDKTKMVRIDYLKKVPMTREDYLRHYRKGTISREEYLAEIRRLKDDSNNI